MKDKKIYMMAICGMGMGSLAGYLKECGAAVKGSDENIYPPMSDFLGAKNIRVFKGYNENNLNDKYDAVIIGNAITRKNPEAQKLLNSDLKYYSMPGFIKKYLLKEKISIVVSGTHGKTTTASLLGWAVEFAGLDPSVFVGGIVNNWNKSYRKGSGKYFVLEGDEYDSSFFDKVPKFLHYNTHDLILTGIEFDHADIYGSLEQIKAEFTKLVKSIPKNGNIVAYGDDENVKEVISYAKCNVTTYGMSNENDYTLAEPEFKGSATCFDLLEKGKKIIRIESPLLGKQNIQNAMAVFILLSKLGLNDQKIIEGIKSFPGVKRRQEIVAKISNITIIDDFAHHPTAVSLTLEGFRLAYPDARIWAVFEPRTNTARRKYFQDELVNAFQSADKIIISDVFKKESLGVGEALDVEALIKSVNKDSNRARFVKRIENIVEIIVNESISGDIIVIMSNGGFGGIYSKLTDALKKKKRPI